MIAASPADQVLLEIEAQRFAEEVGIPPCPEILARFAAEMHSADPDMSSKVAAVASGLATRLKGIEPAAAHTYALFRDCGLPVLMRKFAIYGEVVEANRAKPGKDLIIVEENRFRLNHAHVGFALARGWLLPDAMCKSILYHHEPDKLSAFSRDLEPANPTLVAFGMLAEQVVALRDERGLCPDWVEHEGFVLETLGLTAGEVVELALEGEAVAA